MRTNQRQAGVIPAPNRLNQDFSAFTPNRKWVSDFTYIQTADGWLYLALVLDLFSRRGIGWAMSTKMDAALVETALRMALLERRPPARLLHHSDQGSGSGRTQHERGRQLLRQRRHGELLQYLKTECVTGIFLTHAQARTVIFEYMEVWYNRQRLHSTLGYLSPVDFDLGLTL